MNHFILYQLKVALCIGAFTGVYYLLLRKETFHRFNRFYQLSVLILSFVIPALHFKLGTGSGRILPLLLNSVTVVAGKVTPEGATATQPFNLLYWVYFLFVFAFAMYLIVQLGRMVQLVLQNPVSEKKGYRVVHLRTGSHSFSFFNLVFIRPAGNDGADDPRVISHELAHARQLHSADIMLVQCIKIFQWFNPFVYLLEKAIQETHEYMADQAVLEQNSPPDTYRLLLLSQVFGVQPGIFSFFNHSLLKNRLIMMTKQKSPQRNRFKYMAALPLLVLLVLVMCCNLDKNAISEDLAPPPPPPPPPTEAVAESEGEFLKVDEQALFQGGDISAFRGWVQSKLVYPEDAIKNGVSGKVMVQFSISETGKIRDVKVLRGVYPSLDKETVRVIEMSPDWVPAKVNGKDVAQQFVMPVVFMLQ